MTRIQIASRADGFEFDALSAAAQGARRGGVVVIQEIFGLDRYVFEDVERWSAAGFEALAPSLFDRQGRDFVVDTREPADMQAGMARAQAHDPALALADVLSCVGRLAADGPVFVVGYCFGGSLAWKVAAEAESGVAAVSCYYGGQIPANAALALHCPTIAHFGGKDAFIPADAAVTAIHAAHPDVPVYVYARSGHGFNNAGRPDSDPEDAALARVRTVAHFVEAGGRAPA
ncbi:dienelactone hydrolase family protein [Sphingomonas sp.]|uniref:dienelactone hydrolase family protein n=1 Tax=Sphingomonas sp. TaxID=28214 RepID=UPI000DAFBCDA|nr:dienelactone hydrolase family protein [Sphingomonas sp.]PZU06529.1 MAG: dienelactone hydrolase [Sphingomonas sp.]